MLAAPNRLQYPQACSLESGQDSRKHPRPEVGRVWKSAFPAPGACLSIIIFALTIIKLSHYATIRPDMQYECFIFIFYESIFREKLATRVALAKANEANASSKQRR